MHFAWRELQGLPGIERKIRFAVDLHDDLAFQHISTFSAGMGMAAGALLQTLDAGVPA